MSRKPSSWILAAALAVAVLTVTPAGSQEYNISPPSSPVNLLWIHHSTGTNWSHKFDPGWSGSWNDGIYGVDRGFYATRHHAIDTGGNGELALYNNNYILHHLSYGATLGEDTEYCHWYRKFRNYLDTSDTLYYVNDVGGEDLLHCYAQNISYAEQGQDEFTSANIAAQFNRVIMFKSCFPNSDVSPTSTGLPSSPTLADARDWITSGGYTAWLNSGGPAGPINFIQAEYLGLLDVFGEPRNRNTLFVAWVAPPQTDIVSTYARTLADWFEYQWLANYPYDNVLLFNYFNIHTGEHQPNGDSMPAMQEKHNHARYNPFLNRRDYVGPGDPDFVNDLRMAFHLGGPFDRDSHPSHFAGAVATKELIHLLNIQWNRLNGIAPSGPTGYPSNGQMALFRLDSSFTSPTPTGVTHGTIDGVDCLIFDGTANAYLDLGPVPVVGAGGAFSYCFWYRPNDNSVNYPSSNSTVILSKDGVFRCYHFAENDIDSHINTEFGGDFCAGPDHQNEVVDVDTWTHVAFAYDGNQVRHFVDGVQIIETTTTVRTVTDTSNSLLLGGVYGNLCGGIREVAIYNRALTPAEVRQIFLANAGAMPAASARRWHRY